MEKLLFIVYFVIVPPGAPRTEPYVESHVVPAEKCEFDAQPKYGPIKSQFGYSYVSLSWCEDADPAHPRVNHSRRMKKSRGAFPHG